MREARSGALLFELMTRTTLRILTLLGSGASLAAVSVWTEISPWAALPAVPLTWFALTTGGRALHSFVVARRVQRDRKFRRQTEVLRAVDIASRLRSIATGEPGFTRHACPMPALERAVLFPASPGNEHDVTSDVALLAARERRLITEGLVSAVDAAVSALSSPFHPMYMDAEPLLPMFGLPVPRIFGCFRAARAWKRLRREFVPSRARETIAIRLLHAGMPTAALRALRRGKPTARRRALRRLARLLIVVRQGESGLIGFRSDRLGPWAAPIVLVVGRRLKDLVPGSVLVESPPRGAATLELATRRVPHLVRELTRLQTTFPGLRGAVRDVLALVLSRDPQGIEQELLTGTVEARPDAALACHLRGLALLAERRPHEAIADFEHALRSADDFASAAYALAVAHRRTGNLATGTALLRAHAKSRPADCDAAVFLARFLGETGDRYGARRAYRDAIRRFPEASYVRVTFAMELQNWGEGRAAAEQFDLARTAQPSDARLALLTGRARVTAGRPADAVEPLEQAAAALTGEERSEAMFWLLSALRGGGQHDRATVLAVILSTRLGKGQDEMLDDVAEYLEERHDFVRARKASERARRLRGEEW